MDEGALLLGILIIAVIAIGVFSNVSSFGGNPQANPPNPSAEFGVVHEQASFFSNFFGFSSGNSSPPPASGNAGQPRSGYAPNPGFDNPAPSTSGTPTTSDIQKNISVYEEGARRDTVANEYIRVSYSAYALGSINVTGWTISNTRGESFPIGGAAALPGSTSFRNQDPVVIQPGGVMYVITGQSPRGESFRKNKCTGYFNQSSTFSPSLPNDCPDPRNEPGEISLSDSCHQYIRSSLFSCSTPNNLPLYLDNTCHDFIERTTSYNACVNLHRSDADFFGKDWWVYLSRPTQMWSDVRDTITVKDSAGHVIATRSYN